jgi:hypothetical protein
MKENTAALTAVLNEISTKVYQAASEADASEADASAGDSSDEETVDADYEVVDDNE